MCYIIHIKLCNSILTVKKNPPHVLKEHSLQHTTCATALIEYNTLPVLKEHSLQHITCVTALREYTICVKRKLNVTYYMCYSSYSTQHMLQLPQYTTYLKALREYIIQNMCYSSHNIKHTSCVITLKQHTCVKRKQYIIHNRC